MSFSLAIGGGDMAIIVVYLAAIVALGCFAGLDRKHRLADDEGYFLAGRSLGWPIIGMALFSTNISTLELVSFAEEGYKSGLVYGNLELLAPLTLILLAIYFAPFYVRSGIATLPEYLERRYSRGCRRWLVVTTIASAVFIHLGFALFTGGKLIEGLFGLPLTMAMAIVLGFTGLYTIIGGLRAVAITEAVQTVILLLGASVLTLVALRQAGGWHGLTETLAAEPERLSLLRPAEAAHDMPWYAVMLGYPVIGTWYWCTDQTIVQRVLGAKDERHAQVGPLFTGFIKVAALFIFVLPGLLCYALVEQGALEAPVHTSHTLSHMIAHLLPAGFRGLVVAALLSALMSTVAGALNSIATVFCYDIYRELRPDATDRQMVRAGRTITFVAMAAAMVWAHKIENFGSILAGNTAMISYLAPSITAVFVGGVFWKGASKAGALATLAGGGLLGLAVFLLDWNKDVTGWAVPALLSSFYLFVVSVCILAVASRVWPVGNEQNTQHLVWSSPWEALRSPGWKGVGNYKFLAATLLLVVVGVYIAFR